MITDPAAAPPRTDLAFLRRRARPRTAPASPALTDFLTGHSTHRAPAGVAAPEPALARPPAPGASASLDLSDAPAAVPAAAPTRPVTPTVKRARPGHRIGAGEHEVLSLKQPTVTLTRVQSGIGRVSIEAVCSPEVGDLRLGAVYQLSDGVSSTVQYAGGNRFAPSSRRPVIVAGRDEYEHLRVDLRRVRELERLAVYAFSESRTDLSWGGTLVVETFGGARIELPLETLYRGRVAVVLSLYNLDGELVVRAEMETIEGDVREAARAYGYDRITWRDDRTPVD